MNTQQRFNQNEVIYVKGSGAVPKMTLWYDEDDEVSMYEQRQTLGDIRYFEIRARV